MKKIAIVIATALYLALFLSACQKETIQTEQPRAEGLRELVINTSFTDGIFPEDYLITITGPKNFSITHSGNSLLLNDMVEGEYLIEVSKEGYIHSVKSHYFSAPADKTVSFRDGIHFQLNKQIPGIAIDHEKGGMISIPADGNLMTEEMEVFVPPGALEGTGTTEISISPAMVDISVKENEWVEMIHAVSLVCEPSGIVFDKPIQVKIPLDPSIPADQQQVELVLFEEDPITGEVRPSKDPADRVTAIVDVQGGFAIAEIPHFSIWGWTNYGPGNSEQHSWRWRTTEGDPNGPVLWTAWDCIDQSPAPGETVSGTYTAIPTTIPSDPNNSPVVNRYCNEPPPQPCILNVTDNYSYTPVDPDNYGKVEARNRFIFVDIASEINGGGTIQTFQQAYDLGAATIEFRYSESPNPSNECQ